MEILPPPPRRLRPAPAALLRQPQSSPAPAPSAAPKVPQTSTQTISIDALCKLTGFTDAELRLLANRHYFAKEKNGQYELTAAIQGCFRRRKEQAGSADGLPVYDNLGQCAGQTGIALTTLKQAKKAGCTAFVAHRVHLAPLLRYLHGELKGEEAIQGKAFFDHWHGLREKIKYEEESGKALNKDEITFGINKGMSLLFSMLDRRSNLELPPSLKGLDEIAIQKRLVESDEKLKAVVREELNRLVGSKNGD
jgi:hypothetical protein